MAEQVWTVPQDSEFWPCPEGCGGDTEDPYGGPCKRCWDKISDNGNEAGSDG